jgi:hypothetical protein
MKLNGDHITVLVAALRQTAAAHAHAADSLKKQMRFAEQRKAEEFSKACHNLAEAFEREVKGAAGRDLDLSTKH